LEIAHRPGDRFRHVRKEQRACFGDQTQSRDDAVLTGSEQADRSCTAIATTSAA
jgi:hypothetical protein